MSLRVNFTPILPQSFGAKVIHTTANHSWLTTDRSWVLAGTTQAGEPVPTLDGATATVAAVRTVTGAARMWDLTVATTHTFAVGDAQAVVHNCGEVNFKLSLSKVRGPEDIEAAERFIKQSNDLIAQGHRFVRTSVDDALRQDASTDTSAYGRLMKKAGFSMLDWYGEAFHAEHIPDTTWTGVPKPPGGYMRLPGWINSSFGSQAAHNYEAGWVVSRFTLPWVP